MQLAALLVGEMFTGDFPQNIYLGFLRRDATQHAGLSIARAAADRSR
jgi:hypothetical protein